MESPTLDEEKHVLKLLLEWKERLRCCDEQHPESCFENFQQILSPALFTVEDSPSRRSLFFVLEKMVMICWQECQYGKRNLSAPYLDFVGELYGFLVPLVTDVKFEECELVS